ncbi:MAG: tRNA (adenosine(37)-N6)-dimethylallyltransferase MiaA [SAR324 cluster bacterium]|nr:tRNA (adenosine(37)-N6)-dimethylallyltransferase MiaA [SAR324 cluster bacterium]
MNPANIPFLVAVTGPTSSGKSSLALWLAEMLGGELICCDSMQVYRGLDIGTAKPTPAERIRIAHHLLDIVNIDEIFSAGDFVRETERIIKELQSRNKVPILGGGTGLYLRSLLFGLSPIPEISPETKLQVNELISEGGTRICWERLKELDPSGTEKLHPNDSSRIMRALEVILSTGKPLSSFQQIEVPSNQRYSFYGMVCDRPREELYERINNKTLEMLEQGWIDEVRSLLDDYPDHLKPLQSIGYREIILHLKGELTESELIPLIQQRTRQYAKRQLTWFRRESHLIWKHPDDKQRILEECRVCLEKIGQNLA